MLIVTDAKAQLPSVDAGRFATTPIVLQDTVLGINVKVPSRGPTDYGAAMRGELGAHVDLTAQLFLPALARGGARGRARHPAIIFVPGSGGIGPHHLEQVQAMVRAGFAVLLMDPFYARGIVDTIADQGRLTWAASAYDVLAALAYLRARPDIDANRVGAVGNSRGGTAVLMAAAGPFSDAIVGPHHGLRAVVAGYPWCGTQFRSARLARGTALMVLQGDRDDWVSVQQCQDAVHAMSVAGGNATMKIFAGGLHALDRTNVAPTRIETAVTSTIYPTVYMDDAGRYFDLRSGKVDPALKASDFIAQSITGGFLHRGVTVGTSGTQAADYVSEMVEFMKNHLK